MKGWIEIFRTGTHTSSEGITKTWTEADLDKIAASYGDSSHEAPVVIGHPEKNAPAYGWVKAVKRQGNLLLAKLTQVAPEFAELVKAGRYKKRSISLYPDGTLRHIGFLGAQPPAVKGLADIAFNDSNQDAPVSYDFSDDVSGGRQQPNNKEEEMATIEELQAKIAELEKDNAEQKTAREKAENSFAEAVIAAREKDIRDFIEAGIKDGKILPAWKEKGMAEFMASLEGEETFDFAEGQKISPAAWFKSFVESLAGHSLFKEFADPDKKRTQQDTDFSEDERIAEEMAADYK